MLLTLNPLALKKMLMNIFFSTFSLLGRPQACDTVAAPCPELRQPNPCTRTEAEPKPRKNGKSAFYPAEDPVEVTPSFPLSLPEPCRKKQPHAPQRRY
jgi:hypothetical protein